MNVYLKTENEVDESIVNSSEIMIVIAYLFTIRYHVSVATSLRKVLIKREMTNPQMAKSKMSSS